MSDKSTKHTALDQVISAEALGDTKNLSEMMSRVPVDMEAVMRTENAGALLAATTACARCGSVEACEDWLVHHEQGGGHETPGFCPNGRFIEAAAPKKR